ncbi:HEAT repeat domain-containing protein [bacterium]|nr:HEAT repeat domain-containing protein [bacterium]
MFDDLMQLLPINIDKLEKDKDVRKLRNILTKYKDPNKRMKAAYALGRITGDPYDKQAETILSNVASDESQDPAIRNHCVLSLGKQQTENSKLTLFEFLHSNSEALRASAIRALCDFKTPDVAVEIANTFKGTSSEKIISAVSDSLEGANQKAVVILNDALFNENEQQRAKACRDLNFAKSKRIIEFLVSLLNGEDEFLRRRSAMALASIESEIVISPLMARLDKEKGENLKNLYLAIGKIKSDKTLDCLLTGLDSDDPDIKGSCIYGLCEKKSDKAVSRLIDILSDSTEKEEYRIAIVKYFGKTKNTNAMNVMVALIRNSSEALCNRIQESLIEMNLPDLPKLLQPYLSSTSDSERLIAVKVLTKIQKPGTASMLFPLLKDSVPDIRNLVIIGLGGFKEPDVSDELLNIAQDRSQPSQLRGQATRSIGMIADPRMIYPLFELLKDSDEYVRGSAAFALGSFKNPEVIDVLGNALNDKSDFVRSMVVEAFGYLKDPKALEYLKKAREDSSDKVKGVVARVLRNM